MTETLHSKSSNWIKFFTFCPNDELLHAITASEEKSHCTTIMVSSPDAPGGLLETIEKDRNSKDKKLLLDYNYGLDKLYNRQEMKMKKLEPEFRRECMGYNHSKSNLSATQIDDCIQTRRTTKEYPISNYDAHSVGVEFEFFRVEPLL